MCLLLLIGQGDMTISLVSPVVMAWIESPFIPPNDNPHRPQFSYNETMPPEVIAEHRATDPNYTGSPIALGRGSFENDRALNAPGMCFECFSDLIAHVVANNIEITQEYNGHLY